MTPRKIHRTLSSLKKNVLYFIFFCTCFFGSEQVSAQRILPDEPVQEKLVGNRGEDVVFDMAENQFGEIAAIGTSSRSKEGGSNIFFLPINKKLEHISNDSLKSIGRSGDDGATFITSSYEGYWLVAGYSETPSRRAKDAPQAKKYYGKKDGWFLILDQSGKPLRDFILGGAEDDEFNGVFPLIDGGFLLTGNSNNSAWVLRLDKKLQVVWEQRLNYHSLPAQIRSAVCTFDESLFFVGTLEESNENKMWIGGISSKGEKIFDKIFPVSQATEGASIVEINEKTLGICGYHNHPRNRENGFFCTIDRSGNPLKYSSVGGREFDKLNDLTLLFNGDIALVGTSNSFSRGARRSSAWTVVLSKKNDYKYDPNGGKNSSKPDEQYYGSKLSDAATTLLQRADGSLLAAGFSSKKILKAEEAWIFQLTPKPKKKAKIKEPRITLENIIYPNESFLAKNERAFQTILIENEGTEGITDAQIRVQNGRVVKLFEVGVIPPQSKRRISLPIEYNMVGSDGKLAFEIIQDNTVLLTPNTLAVNRAKPTQPNLALEVSHGDFELGKAASFDFTVKNSGDGTADNVLVLLNGSSQIKLPPQYSVGSLKPNESRQFKISADVVGIGAATLSAHIGDESFVHTDSVKLFISIAKQATNKTEAVTTTQPKPETKSFVNAFWIAPNPDQFDHKEIVWDEPEIAIQIKAVSSKDIEKQHFELEVNGQSSRSGAKFDEVSLRGSSNSRTFQNMIKLKEGVNTIKATIKNEVGKAETELLKIVYSPRKPNLHVLAIGVPQADLKYTAKDGRDFVKAITGNSNHAFQTVFVDTLFTEKNTTKTEILKTMRRLDYRFKDKQIAENDVLVVFISSHGLTQQNGDFRIAAGDYDSPFMQETSLSFEKEIVDYLNKIGCAKLFFLDACHSGESGISSDAHFNTDKKNVNMLVSCRADEYSYEDDRWQNGAFTEALVQAFDDFKLNKSLDLNNDNALDVQELFRHVERQVPQLVNQKKPKPTTEQHPVLILQESNKPLVLLLK